MDQSAKFWDKIAERYSKRPIADEAAVHQIERGKLANVGHYGD